MCDDERSHSTLELVSTSSQDRDHHRSMLKMTTTPSDGQEELDVANKVKTGPANGQLKLRASSRRSKKTRNNQMDAQDALRSIVQRLLVWSARRTFHLSHILAITLFASSMVILNVKCDDEMQQTNAFSGQQNQQQQQQQVELFDLMKQQQQNQRDPRGIFNLDELLNTQGSSSSLSYNLISPTNEPPMAYNSQASQEQQQQQTAAGINSGDQNAVHQQQNEQQMIQEQRANDLAESDQLETAQTSARGNSVASAATQAMKSSESSEKAADAAPAQSNVAAPPASSSTGSSSASTSSLTDHLSAVNNLLHQAGQIGLSAAQQNVALSEAIINSVTNSLVGNTRKQNAQQQAQAAQVQVQQSARPSNVVGQSIDGNIEYNPNSNTIDGFINFPGLNGSKPSLSGAMRPLLLAAIKTVPIKFGSVGWKLLKLLAWKKIYKAHHPKSGEIIIEQEMKHGGHGSGGGDIADKGSKLGKISDHFENKFKTSKMGNSYSGGGSDDWSSMMRTPSGLGGDMFSSGWPHGDSHAASASMIYQRHLLPPGATNPLMGGGGGGGVGHQQAAAAAAAAAATAAAIQSHWQQQQQMMADESNEGQSSRSNQTSSASQGGQAGALRRKKATYGGSNWFAANPAHTYAAAAAAANAAAAMASQQQQHQQQQQRLANIMRAYELGGQSSVDQIGSASGAHGGSMHHALATGLMYQSLFDNAAAMAVQNTVRLPGMDHQAHHHSNPLANAEFLDQSDTLSGSSFDSFASSSGGGPESMHDSNPLALMQRHDLDGNIAPGEQQMRMSDLGDRRPSADSMLTFNEQSSSGLPVNPQFGPHRSGTIFDSMTEFDDTPAGKLVGHAINVTTSIYPGRPRYVNYHRQNIK